MNNVSKIYETICFICDPSVVEPIFIFYDENQYRTLKKIYLFTQKHIIHNFKKNAFRYKNKTDVRQCNILKRDKIISSTYIS